MAARAKCTITTQDEPFDVRRTMTRQAAHWFCSSIYFHVNRHTWLPLRRMTGALPLYCGASGITGWAILREALSYPGETAFKRVIALFNRPVNRSELLLPEDDRITIASGINLTDSVQDVAAALSAIDNIDDVTDVFFAGTLSCWCSQKSFCPPPDFPSR